MATVSACAPCCNVTTGFVLFSMASANEFNSSKMALLADISGLSK